MLLTIRKREEIMNIFLDNENTDKVLTIGRAFGLTQEVDEVKEMAVIKLLIFDQVNSYKKDKELFIRKWKNNENKKIKQNLITPNPFNKGMKKDDALNKNWKLPYPLKLPLNISDSIKEIKKSMGSTEKNYEFTTRIIIKGIRETFSNPYLSEKVIKDAQNTKDFFRDKIISRYEEYFKMKRKEINVHKDDIIEWELMKIALKNVNRLDWKIEEEID